jgi:Tfp pilus assembly protein PilX
MLDVKRYPRESLPDEKGMVLVVALLLISVLLLLGTTAVMTSTTDMKISTNYKTGNQAFYVAEAGIEEARARLKGTLSTNPNCITDSYPTNTGWAAFIGMAAKSQGKGYNSGNAMHVRVDSIQSTLDYTVKIEHQRNAANQILYWGDVNGDGINERTTSPTSSTGMANKNIYLVTSYGVAANANKTIETEITRAPPITAPAALYVEAVTTIQGTSTNVIGADQCGGANLPGVVTTLLMGTVTAPGSSQPTVCGAGQSCCGFSPFPACGATAPWDVVGGGTNMDIQSMINDWKGSANYQYNMSNDHRTNANWGIPTLGATLQNPSSCSTSNVVYFNTQSTYVQLNTASGCGLLLVDGDLEVYGSFSWHGMVIVSGSVRYLGGGNKNITGAVLAGGSMDADLVGGNANIVYCSSAINDLSESQSLRRLSWKEKNI